MSLPPDTICGYRVLRGLPTGSYLALGEGARQVLLKPLDPDCLLHGQLHPDIKQRLARVRELALKSAANLHGVMRDERGVFLVWEYVEGQTLEQFAAALAPMPLSTLLREVVLSIDALHQAGIVHGALHARNIILDPTGRPRITHISPLLYDDPSVDRSATVAMLHHLIAATPQPPPALVAAVEDPASLRDLAGRLALAAPTQADPSAGHADADDSRRRLRLILLAAGVALAGTIGAIALALLASRH
jgi:serine/threonine protein kinase